MRFFLRFIVLILIVGGCSQSDQKTANIQEYFDLDSLVKTQVELILQSEKKLTKQVILDGETESQSFTPTKEQLEDEFKVFLELDLNQPNYVGAYMETVTESVLRYDLKPDQESAVKFLEISYENGDVNQITGQFVENKDIYNHEREVVVNFREDIIASYTIIGNQDMIIGDSVYFKIDAELK